MSQSQIHTIPNPRGRISLSTLNQLPLPPPTWSLGLSLCLSTVIHLTPWPPSVLTHGLKARLHHHSDSSKADSMLQSVCDTDFNWDFARNTSSAQNSGNLCIFSFPQTSLPGALFFLHIFFSTSQNCQSFSIVSKLSRKIKFVAEQDCIIRRHAGTTCGYSNVP